ncbi:MAG: phytanoyl-CoA dioxygenase family protein [Proteobacteria bacterium]|nr:phytanoyl-CoA dioxygenase family protein [Pseudomonadota bacterium]
MAPNLDVSELRTRFQEDGVVFLPGVLDARALELAAECYEWTLNHPGPGAGPVLLGTPGTFYQDQANPDSYPAYRRFLREAPLADVAAALFGCDNVWLMYEQIWLKDGADTRRTPWHQDLPYLPASGEHLMVMWANLDPVAKDYSLEFIRGSHRGPLYNPSAFNPDDEAANLFDAAEWPPLPAIEQAREAFPIVSWDIQPGDVVAFHPAVLHGGAPTRAGVRRRTLSLRFFGDDARVARRPHDGMANVDGLKHDDGGRHPLKKMALAEHGTPFRHEDFPQLRPR